MDTGLELERLETWGETEREERRMLPGVPGGVTPLPLALLSPITFTSSLTETPCSSGGMSLLTTGGGGGGGGMGLLTEGGLAEDPLRDPFSNNFWKNDGFDPGADDVAAGEGVLLEGEADLAADMERLCLGGGVGF